MTQLSTDSAIPRLLQPVTVLKGVGPKVAAQLAQCGIESLQDMLFHLPYRYQDRTRITPIAWLRDGDVTVIEGTVVSNSIRLGPKPSLQITLRDGSGELHCRFFHFNKAQQLQLAIGTRVRCFGECRYFAKQYTMVHPEYLCISETMILPVAETLTPIYRTCTGLQQRSIAKLIRQALDAITPADIPELLPKNVVTHYVDSDLYTALITLHYPPPDISCELLEEAQHPLQQRLIFEELVAHQCALQRLRKSLQSANSPVLPQDSELVSVYVQQLPFVLTGAQQRVIAQIAVDLAESKSMLRLLQGDVGAGKTQIAIVAALQAIAAGYQAVLMAPTEILVEQHAATVIQCLASLPVSVAWITGSMPAKQKRAVMSDVAIGAVQFIIGTHALFQKDMQFSRLGLVIIDEQHRFGVQQRLALCSKGEDGDLQPHQLMMTATPIPRTLAMSVYGHLDISLLDELPPGRTPVQTIALNNLKREEVITRIQQVCQQGRQVYWVCTLIAESETLQCQAAEDCYVQLQELLPELRIALIHGRLSATEKDNIMQQFTSNNVDLLVATTVIEVGVNVPNASLMVIENAERLGLAQLHQLRGRVGRGAHQSYCVLLYQTPLSQEAKQRLQILRETNDGFRIAEEDLRQRGPGEVLGTRQSGVLQYRIADVLRDSALLAEAQSCAKKLLLHAPAMVESLILRWVKRGEQYGKV